MVLVSEWPMLNLSKFVKTFTVVETVLVTNKNLIAINLTVARHRIDPCAEMLGLARTNKV